MIDDAGNHLQVEPVSGEAALIATFYGPRGGQSIQALHQALYGRLSPEPRERVAPARWENRENPVEEVFGRCFEPSGRAAIDTTVVQLALNAPGSAAEAWKIMRKRLEDALWTKEYQEGNKALEGIWGYTLVYQAVLKAGVDSDSALGSSMAAIGPLGSDERVEPLSAADVPGGRVWLLGIPDHGDGWAAGTVYCAMGPPEGEETLLDMFYGPTAVLLTPDLIVHKGYFQMRQYRDGDLHSRYEDNLLYLRKTTNNLLERLGQHQSSAGSPAELSQTYYRLMPVVYQLKELHVGMLRQLENFGFWREGVVVAPEFVEFHRRQLGAATRELEFMVEPLEDAVEAADKVVSVARLQEDKEITVRLTRVEWFLAVVTLLMVLVELMLGVPHLMELIGL